MSEEHLYLFLNETLMGTLFRSTQGKLRFCYDKDYLRKGPGIPLSLSMPLQEECYPHEKVTPFLWGLLPDNDLLLERWAARFQVSASNPFALLGALGEDCAGALRFVSEDHLKKVHQGGKKKLTMAHIEERLSALQSDPSLGRTLEDQGQFSLAGAQAKTALQKVGSQWFLPWGNEPTTHILKPPRPDLNGHVENEHFCLQLAACLGLETAASEVVHFGKASAIVVTRYDRIERNKKILRLHQEDMCQALSISPSRKYENMGGPGIPAIMELLNQSSSAKKDRDTFMRAILFNYLILGSDAHGKNYSLLLGNHGEVRLAPLYDIASLLPYTPRPRDQRLSMRIDHVYRDDQITPRHFERMARRCEYSYPQLHETIQEYLSKIPELSKSLCAELYRKGIRHPVLRILNKSLQQRCTMIAQEFQTSKT